MCFFLPNNCLKALHILVYTNKFWIYFAQSSRSLSHKTKCNHKRLLKTQEKELAVRLHLICHFEVLLLIWKNTYGMPLLTLVPYLSGMFFFIQDVIYI